MPLVTAVPLPPESALHAHHQPGDFLDCYAVVTRSNPRAAANQIVAFPAWARGLLQLRRLLTSPFGLSQEGPVAHDKIGPFAVESETDTELIAGFNDKHLDFRISVRCDGERTSLATWVHTHNLGGRLYLTLILPFHILIAKNALRRLATHT